MRRTILTGIVLLIIAAAFVFLYPYFFWDTDFSVIQKLIAVRIRYLGLRAVLTQYLLSAYQEEMVYRGPVLLFLLIFPERYAKSRSLLAWLLVIGLSHIWAQGLHGDYAMFYRAVIFSGGLINGACVIHFQNKAAGILAAVFLHSLVNALVVLTIYFFLM